MDSPTFAHSICVSLQLTVFHAWNEVKQSKNLFLGESGSSRHHQAACDVPGAVVHELIAAWVTWTGEGQSTPGQKPHNYNDIRDCYEEKCIGNIIVCVFLYTSCLSLT